MNNHVCVSMALYSGLPEKAEIKLREIEPQVIKVLQANCNNSRPIWTLDSQSQPNAICLVLWGETKPIFEVPFDRFDSLSGVEVLTLIKQILDAK